MFEDVAAFGLALFFLTWAVSFWHKTEPLRERLGVYVVYGAGEEPVDRVDGGGLGGWLNCPMCAALLVSPAAVALLFLCRPALDVLAGLGLALLLVRWWEGAREKARWWI